jgi:hypothetical protein
MPSDFGMPTAFTPFIRRFTDERARDLDDTRRLYKRVRALHRASRCAAGDALTEIGGDIYASLPDLSEPLDRIASVSIDRMLRLETCVFDFPEINWWTAHLSLKEQADLRHFLRAKEYFHAHEHKVLTLLKDGLSLIFGHITGFLPETFDPSPFTVPLIFALPEPRKLIDGLICELWAQKYVDAGVFVEAARAIYFNLCRVSGIADPNDPKKPFKLPTDNDGTLPEIVESYLASTPFRDFFLAPIPLRFTHEERFSHMHVLGGSGAGKTTLLQNLILSDLASDDPPALVIVDSQGDLIDKLSHLAVFDPDHGPLADRLVLITPKDTRHPPALNIFDVNHTRFGAYDEATREQVTAGVIQTFDYLFAGLLGADLTAKQGVFFRFVARLMLALPETMGRNATILDMIALMDDPTPYKAAIDSLPPIQRNFFERDFASKTFVQTKEQIRYRLNAILENPTLARLFTAPETRIDLFDILNNGGVILVDTAKDFLKGASAHFGRIFISLVLQAVLERAAIPEYRRRPTFLIVDEAAAYFDSNIDDFLTEARKYKCGCVFAHQFLDQATSALRASLAANTAIKMAGGVSTSDARALASDMRTTADFILGQPRLHFACHVRNVTPNAVSIPVPVGMLENQPKLSDESFEVLRVRNRLRVGLPTAEAARAETFTADGEATGIAVREQPQGPQSSNSTSKDPSAASDEW